MRGLNVVITGGSGALGRAVVSQLTASGARCYLPLRSSKAEASLEALAAPSLVTVAPVNLTDADEVRAFYESVPDLWASIHVVGGFTMAPLLDTSADDFRAMFELNALSCFLACREAVRAMRRRGPGPGRIVNITARPALQPTGGMIAYSTSKAAVVSITTSLADELRDEGILVNAIAPSVMDTPTNRAAMPEADWSRWPKVTEVAAAVRYLAGPQNRLTTGLVMPVYGRA